MLLYYIYFLASILITPFYILFLIYRVITKKQELLRLLERFGISGIKNDFKKIVWIHSVSIGETKIALSLVKNLSKIQRYSGITFLLTTNTKSSYDIVKKENIDNLIHQYIFIDNYFCIKFFYAYWKPIGGILIESDIFPNTINFLAKHMNLVFFNARLSDKSYKKWIIFKGFFTYIINKFTLVVAQSDYDFEKYKFLVAENLEQVDNMKYFSAFDLDDSSSNLVQNAPRKNIKSNKIVILAASTHSLEEEGMISALLHKIRNNDVLLVIAPRHINRTFEIEIILKKYDILYELRSSNKESNKEMSKNTQVYIVDTFGELNLLYSIADISLICGSFNQFVGGHNIIEPAYFETLICFGPHMSKCREIADQFIECEAGLECKSFEDVDILCSNVINDRSIVRKYSKNARELVQKKREYILNKYAYYVDKHIL